MAVYTSKDDNVVPMYKDKSSVITNLRKSKLEHYVAAGAIALSSFFAGQCYTNTNDSRVNIPSNVIGAPKNMTLIDYTFLEDNVPEDNRLDQPKGRIVKMVFGDLSKYETKLSGNNRLTLVGPVTYSLDCTGVEDTTLCTDTRECQVTFATIDDKIKN